jgi:hypothetical protein
MPDHHILQKIGNALRIRSKHGRLVHNADPLQIFFRIKANGVLTLKILEELIVAGSEPVTYLARMLAPASYSPLRPSEHFPYCARNVALRFLVVGLAVDYNRVISFHRSEPPGSRPFPQKGKLCRKQRS